VSETTIHDSGSAPDAGEPPQRVTDGSTPQPGANGNRLSDMLRGAVILGAIVVLSIRYPIPMAIVGAIIFFVFLHELGHYLTAKWAGMKVTEFFIGFGPRLWSFRRGETEYGFKAIPAGAYVKIIGMSNMEEVDPAEEHRTYRQKPYWRRLSVAVAGSTVHFLLAIAIMFGLLVGVGLPDPDPDPTAWSVSNVATLDDGSRSPAEEAGLELGDRIIAVDGERFDTFEALSAHLRQNPGERVSLLVERQGGQMTVATRLAERQDPDGETVGFLGVGAGYPLERRGPMAAAVESVTTTGRNMGEAVQVIVGFFAPSNLGNYFETLQGDPPPPANPGEPEGGNRFLSPVGLVNVGSQVAENGLVDLLFLFFIVNVFIGVINLFPMLPFDGGHVVIATYERIRSRKGVRYFADVNKLLPAAYAVIAVFVIFIGFTSLYLDITDPIRFPN
jgi:membrane-associated protease RseP (regulator of RpoE activity)